MLRIYRPDGTHEDWHGAKVTMEDHALVVTSGKFIGHWPQGHWDRIEYKGDDK